MEKLKKLFEPIRIADVQIKNRIVMSPMGLGFCGDDCKVNDRFLDFYVERAKGGVGLIDVVTCYNDFGMKLRRSPGLEKDEFLPGLKKLTDSLHEHGAKVFAQLMHMGASLPSAALEAQSVSASAVRSGLTGEMPRELTIPEIHQTIENLAEGARRAKEVGFDGVELIGTGGYLINQFLCALTNIRTDEYGGGVEGRLRFPTELIRRVREVVGPGYPISYRTCGDSFMPGGDRQEEILVVVKAMEKAGADVINVAVGWHQAPMPFITMGVPRGAYVYLAQGIRQVVKVPVIACHRINDPFLADRIVFEHRADMVGFARPLLTDPAMPKKAQEGRFKEINPCVACNVCFDQIFSGKPVICAFNPAVGREREFTVVPAPKPKKVVVVGGGPGGMTAARFLRMRGHDVTLYEKSDRLGGQLNLATIPPEREEFANAVRFMSNEMERLGVKLEMGKEADADLVAGQKPDVIVVAAGADPIHPDIPGIDGKNVVLANDVLLGKVEVGDRVVVIGGGATGVETALFIVKEGCIPPEVAVFLAKKGGMDPAAAMKLTHTGKKVTVLEMLDKLGRDIGRTTRWTIIQALREHNVETLVGASAVRITEEGVVCAEGKQERLIPADTVVVAVGTRPASGLAESLRAAAPEVVAIGDCVKPRHAQDAIHEAAAAAIKI